jgi:glucosamine-6-phosphate deaminase
MFHLDEYIGIPADHPASFRKYLLERLIRPTGLGRHHLLEGDRDPVEVCRQVGKEIREAPIDCAFVGIGENGHLAFNDPPADFETEEPYLIVQLDAACRRQQVGEGWFRALDDVPTQAISMSVRQILSAREIIGVVPDARKAEAVRASLEGPVTPSVPASILQTHPNTTVYADNDSAALLRPETRARFA